MRLAKMKRRCPECGKMLTGLVIKVVTKGCISYKWEPVEQTEWICESCDQSYVQIRKDGMITIGEWERRFSEDEDPLFLLPNDDDPLGPYINDDSPVQKNWSDRWASE